MEVRLYATLRQKIGQTKIDIKAGPGNTVRDALKEVLELYPILAPDVLTEEGELVDHVQVFLNGRNVRLIQSLETTIEEDQRLNIFPPIGGGCRRNIIEPLWKGQSRYAPPQGVLR